MRRRFGWGLLVTIVLSAVPLRAQVRPQVVDGLPAWARQVPESSAREAVGVGISTASVYAAVLGALLDAVVQADASARSGLSTAFRDDERDDQATTEEASVHARVGPCEIFGSSTSRADPGDSEHVHVRQQLSCRTATDTVALSSEATSVDGQLVEYTESRRHSLDAEHDDPLELLQELGVTIEWVVGADAVIAHAVLVRVPTKLIKAVPRGD